MTRPARSHRPCVPYPVRPGFSLIELLVVMVVTIILAGIMMPALHKVRVHTERLISASNMRQQGMAMAMYSTDNLRMLPVSAFVRHSNIALMQEMQATYVPINDFSRSNEGPEWFISDQAFHSTLVGSNGWEGIGLLFAWRYVDRPDVLYCPAHRGDHPIDRYVEDYLAPGGALIYSNYHYRGDLDRATRRAITLDRDAGRVLLTDGMRTKRDFNHRVGYNSLLGDGSVFWRFDTDGRVYSMLPDGSIVSDRPPSEGEMDLYERVWLIIDDLN